MALVATFVRGKEKSIQGKYLLLKRQKYYTNDCPMKTRAFIPKSRSTNLEIYLRR